MTNRILTKETTFEDWDVANRTTVYKTMPAGTVVVDILRPSNNSSLRLVALQNVDGWIATVDERNLDN